MLFEVRADLKDGNGTEFLVYFGCAAREHRYNHSEKLFKVAQVIADSEGMELISTHVVRVCPDRQPMVVKAAGLDMADLRMYADQKVTQSSIRGAYAIGKTWPSHEDSQRFCEGLVKTDYCRQLGS